MTAHQRPKPRPKLPPGQQLVSADKWPFVGERRPRDDDRPWTIQITGLVDCELVFALKDLLARDRVERIIDLHCVTRWSRLGVRFSGLRLADLLDEAGVLPAARFVSFIARSDRGHSTSLPLGELRQLDALVAFESDGRMLATEHGCAAPSSTRRR